MEVSALESRDDLDRALALAHRALGEEDYKTAGTALDEALFLDPKCDQALFLFGCMMLTAEHPGIARLAFEDCLRRGDLSEPNLAQTYANIGRAWEGLERWELAREYFHRAIDINPKHPAAVMGLSSAAVNSGDYAGALDWGRKSDAIQDSVQSKVNQAFAYLHLGDHQKGWPLYAQGVSHQQWRERKHHFLNDGSPEPVWNGERSARVLITAEQGIGDQIAFCSVIPDMLAQGYAIAALECGPKLERLFAETFPDIEVHGTQFDDPPGWRVDHTHVTTMSELLPHFRQTKESFGGECYLKANPTQSAMWREYLNVAADGPRIGVAWRGGSRKTHGWRRKSTELAFFDPLFQRFPGAHFVSLEYRDDSDPEDYPLHQYRWATHTRDYADTAALVQNLDAIVSVPTSVCHLGGALGVPVFAMVHDRAHFHYGLGMPYYSSVRCYERDKLGQALDHLEEMLTC